ncbi:MAG: radical SAM protein [Candidatus Saccharibacteria bacterium]|nr:radical SAM protein [Candidatus Saccharibacteria bacterium]
MEKGRSNCDNLKPTAAERLLLNYGGELPGEIRSLIEAELEVPVFVSVDETARMKILDSCGMTCTFCHNEGTPVTAAYMLGKVALPNPQYTGGRVSVFENRNGVNFLPGTMRPGSDFDEIIETLISSLGIKEIHLTGGEPTLHRSLPEIIKSITSKGLVTKMTSNGENPRIIEDCARAGLSKINFSIFGTTPEELAEVQHEKYRNIERARRKIESLKQSINTAIKCGVSADANIVMSDLSHAARVERIINEYGDQVSVRLLNDLESGDESYFAIYKLLSDMNAEPESLHIEAGSSNARVAYRLPDGRTLFFKQIRRTVLPETCGGCSLNNDADCKEGYYGVRSYIDTLGNYKIGICIQRMDLTLNANDFLASGLVDEISRFREYELEELKGRYIDRIVGI